MKALIDGPARASDGAADRTGVAEATDDPGWVIRSASESDFSRVQELWRQSDELHGRLRPDFFAAEPPLRSARELRELLGGRSGRLLVADAEGDVVGMLRVQIFDTPSEPFMARRRRGHVDELVVDEKFRRLGLGRALMDAAAHFCRERGAEQLVLTVWAGNDAAERFYRSLGYGEVSRVMSLDLRAR